jgi:chromosome segregation ATPase
MTLQELRDIDSLIEWLDNEQDGAEDAGAVARSATNWHPALIALKTEHKRLEIIDWLAQTGSVQAFLALSDDDKRRWFALAIDESERRKMAEADLAALRDELLATRRQWQQELNAADLRTTRAERDLAAANRAWVQEQEGRMKAEADLAVLRQRAVALEAELKRVRLLGMDFAVEKNHLKTEIRDLRQQMRDIVDDRAQLTTDLRHRDTAAEALWAAEHATVMRLLSERNAVRTDLETARKDNARLVSALRANGRIDSPEVARVIDELKAEVAAARAEDLSKRCC